MANSKGSYLKILGVIQVVCGLIVTGVAGHDLLTHTLETPVFLVVGPILLLGGSYQVVSLGKKDVGMDA